MYVYPGAASVPGPTTSTWAEVLANGNSSGGFTPIIDAGDFIAFDTGGTGATIGANGPTLLLDSPDGQIVLRTPMTTAGAEIGVQVEDATGQAVWRIASFLASDVVSLEWLSNAAFGNFRIGPDPAQPDMYLGIFAAEGDIVFNTDGLDSTVYVNFYSGDRVVFGEPSTGQDQEIEVITTVVQLFEATGLVREMRWTPPSANGLPWVKTFGANAQGQAQAGSQAETADITAALVAAQNDFTPVGGTTARRYRLSTAALGSTITGMTGGADGRGIYIHNLGAASITLTHEDVLSAAANRFLLPGGASLVIAPNGTAFALYDSTSSRWRAWS